MQRHNIFYWSFSLYKIKCLSDNINAIKVVYIYREVENELYLHSIN